MIEQDLGRVPGRPHYTAAYVRGGRLFSYAHQMTAALSYEPQTLLEVGPGPGVVTSALRTLGVTVTTLDIQQDLNPDVVGSVTRLPFEDCTFDVSMCCQVLEHLPFEHFVPALRELLRVSTHAVVLSLPDASPYYEIRLRLPFVRSFSLAMTRRKRILPERVERSWELSGHYWEIGYPRFPSSLVQSAIRDAGASVEHETRVSENPYHHFFILRKAAR